MGRKLYVGNLPYSTTEDQLTELFSRAGKVDNVRVMRDMATGRARGFAFVEMGDSSSADSAIKGLDGREVGGRALRVNEATLHAVLTEARPSQDRPQVARGRRPFFSKKGERKRPYLL